MKPGVIGLIIICIVCIIGGSLLGWKLCRIKEKSNIPIDISIEIKDSLISVFKVDSNKAITLSQNINQVSNKFKVDWKKIAAKIYVESNFDPFAESVSTQIGNDRNRESAIGLLQIKPGTAEMMARELNLNYSDCYLYNELYNLTIGVYYFARLSVALTYDWEKTVRAYNCGLAGYYQGLSSDLHFMKCNYWYKRLNGENDKKLLDDIKNYVR
jgi:soluble lytic murein transglycosylase-like protein